MSANEAMTAFRAGDLDRALDIAVGVLRRSPRDVNALMVQGLVHNARAQHRDAASTFRRLTELEPAVIAHWVNLGTALRSSTKYDEALAAYGRAQALGEASAVFLFNLGLLRLDRGEYVDAHAALASAVRAAPADAEICFYFARTCYDCVRNDEARAALKDWRRLDGVDGRLLCDLAALLIQLGDVDEATAVLELADKAAPGFPQIALRRAQIAERTNLLDQATELLGSIPADSDDPELRRERTALEALLAQRAGDHGRAVEAYEQLIATARTARERADLLFPLAKSLDSLRRYDDAFARLQAAHQAQQEFLRQSAPRFQKADRDPLEITRYGVDADDVARWEPSSAPDAEPSPIFIVAFPRSGTTLLEQMLDAHPQLRSMDEQPFLQNAIERMQALGARYPDRLATLSRDQLDDVRRHYWSRVADVVSIEPGQRLVDKNPLNLLRLPAIRRLFPHSPILLIVRHPCDVVLSCYMQHFRAPDFANLCATLERLGEGFTRSFGFWYSQADLLAPRCMELRYESFVGDVERHARSIAEFLELPWHEGLLDPARAARNRGFISTPSYAQVVQPVNTRAIGRWRNYAKYFGPAIERLDPFLRRWGYGT